MKSLETCKHDKILILYGVTRSQWTCAIENWISETSKKNDALKFSDMYFLEAEEVEE